MIDAGVLAAARGRLSEGDSRIWDRALVLAQGEDAPIRAMLEHALTLPGLESSSPEYQDAVYPHDEHADAVEMARTQSGCGLVTESIWGAGDVSDPRLSIPYAQRCIRGGLLYAIALEKDVASKAGAWETLAYATALPALLPADALIMGCKGCPGTWSLGTFNEEHELNVLFVEDDGVTVHSLDGGQGRPAIAIRTRTLVLAGIEVWLADLGASLRSDGRPSKGRRLQGACRARALPRLSA